VKGRLFDDKLVEVHPDSTGAFGGSWQGRTIDGIAHAWDPDALRFFWEKSKRFRIPIVLDVGANTGSFTLLATHSPKMYVYAFEPAPRAFEFLCSNIKRNDLDTRVQALQYAMMDKEGAAPLHIPTALGASGLATLGDNITRFEGHEDICIPTWTIDSSGYHRVSLIKIDTEGAELMVLKGGERTIKRDKPGILLEYTANTIQFNYDKEEIKELLESWGYTHFEPVGMEDLWASAK
jgi:FkbM family methyltransferase